MFIRLSFALACSLTLVLAACDSSSSRSRRPGRDGSGAGDASTSPQDAGTRTDGGRSPGNRDGSAPADGGMDNAGDGGSMMPPGDLGPAYDSASSYTVSMPGSSDEADIYYPSPADPSRLGIDRFPAVVFMQGANVSRVHYSMLAQEIARYGFVLIVPDLQRSTLLGDGLFPTVELLDRGLAVLASESESSSSPIAGLVDRNRSGVLGHSQGGAAGLEAIGNECSTFLCEGFSYERPDSLRAGAFYGTNREPPLFGSVPSTANDGVAVMLVQGDQDGLASPSAGRETYELLASPPKAYAVLEGANHYSITNTQSPEGAMGDSGSASIPQREGIETVGALMGTYLSAHVTELDAAASALYGSPSDFADVLEDFEVPGGVGPTDPEGPGAQGPCAYETVAGSTSRTVDGSSLSLDVYRPTDAGGPAPVVIFNPGTQLDSEEYAASIEHMASWCYVVVANGRSYSPLSGDSDEEWTSDIEDMVAFARSGGGPVGSDVVDGSRIALVGHSAGAKNSFRALAAGPSLADAIVAWDVSGRNPPLEAVDSLEAPVLLLGERFNAENSTLGMPCAPENQNFEAYFDALPMDLPTLLVEFQNADHMSWLDSRECGLECDLCPTNDAFDASRFQRRSRGFTVAFLETMLRGDDRFESYLFGADMDSEVAAGGLVVQQK